MFFEEWFGTFFLTWKWQWLNLVLTIVCQRSEHQRKKVWVNNVFHLPVFISSLNKTVGNEAFRKQLPSKEQLFVWKMRGEMNKVSFNPPSHWLKGWSQNTVPGAPLILSFWCVRLFINWEQQSTLHFFPISPVHATPQQNFLTSELIADKLPWHRQSGGQDVVHSQGWWVQVENQNPDLRTENSGKCSQPVTCCLNSRDSVV